MSNNDLWGEEEPFTDVPEEAQTNPDGSAKQFSGYVSPVPKQAPKPVKQATPPPPEPEETEEVEETEELEDDFTDVLSDASLRLEQGNLYKMIMNHNLFEGMEADPKALQNVQREIRKFAKEQMEIMLGMRRETATVERLEIDFPFNAVEVRVLKMVAHAASKGESENSDNFVPEVTRVTEEVQSVPSRKTLNPIGVQPKKAVPKPVQSKTTKPLQKASTTPMKRTKLDATIDQICAEEGVPRELLEEGKLLSKPVNELSDQERLERNRLVSQRRGTQVRSDNALPPATPEQMAQLAVAHADSAKQGFSKSPLMAQLLDTVKSMPIKNR